MMSEIKDDTELSIDFKDVLGLEEFLTTEVKRILAIQTCDAELELARIKNILRQFRNKRYFLYSEYLVDENVSILNSTQLKNLQSEGDEVHSNLANLTIIDISNYKITANDLEDSVLKLIDCVMKTESKKVIIVQPQQIISSSNYKKHNLEFFVEKKITNICFKDLTEETQRQFVNRPSISNLNNSDNQFTTAIFRCAKKGHLEVVKFLLQEDLLDYVALDKHGTSALQQAVKGGHKQIVQLLLDKGCDVNHRDNFGMNALAWAVTVGDVNMTDFLMGVGADCNIIDQHGRNLVNIAAKANQWHIVKYLIFCLVDVNTRDHKNITPLERAVKSKTWDIVKYLILEDAKVHTNEQNRFNPIHYAIEDSKWSIALLMLRHDCPLTWITTDQIEAILNKIIGTTKNTYSAFYKVISLGNTELLKILIENNGLNEVSKGVQLDMLLSEPYEKLMLNNVSLPNNIKSFIERKLVELRHSTGQTFKLSENDVQKRIHFVCEQIQALTDKYFISEGEVNQEFLIHFRCIAQNIELLKRSVRNLSIPWEQIEFCLVVFMNFFLNPKDDDFVYRLVLDQKRLLTYLDNFSKHLQCHPATQNSTLEYIKDLEADYRLIKDIYSLNRISFYIKLALSVDNCKDQMGVFVLMRCLQVIGESFKNTTDSPNLSKGVHDYLVLTAPTDIKRILTSLRDSLSHCHAYKSKIQTEDKLKSNFDYFQTILNDLKKIRLQIDFLFYTKKKETFQIFCTKCSNSTNSKNVSRYIDWNSKEEMKLEDYDNEDLKIIKKLVNKLKQGMQNIEGKEQQILSELLHEINNIEKVICSHPQDAKHKYFQTRSAIKYFNIVHHSHFREIPKIDFYTHRKQGLYYTAESILVQFIDLIQSKKDIEYRFDAIQICAQLFHIMQFDAHRINSLQEIETNLSSRSDKTREYIVRDVLIKIENSLEKEEDKKALKQYFLDKKKLHEEFNSMKKKKLNITKKDKKSLERNFNNNNTQIVNNIIGIPDEYAKLLKTYNSDKFHKILKEFCTPLNSISVNNAIETFIEEEDNTFKNIFIDKLRTLSNIINENEESLHENLALQAAAEILLLDIMDACLSKGSIREYVLSFKESTPLLVGSALRNYLAHGTVLIDVLPFNPINSIIATVKILAANEANLFVASKEVQPHLSQNNFKMTSKEKFSTNTLINNSYQPFIENCCYSLYRYFLEAAKNGDLQLIKYIMENLMLSKKKNNGDQKKPEKIANIVIIWPAILLASKNGHEQVVEILLDLIQNSDIKNKINYCVFKKIEKYLSQFNIRMYKSHNKNETLQNENFLNAALNIAATKGNYKIINILLKRFKNRDILKNNNIYCLHSAASGGHEEVIKILLENHADVNTIDLTTCTPLHYAANNGHLGTVELLLQNNAHINAQDEDLFTPLHFSAVNGYTEVTRFLLEQGADPNALTNKNITALYLAAQNDHTDVGEILLAYHANVNALDCMGKTPIYIAVANGCERFIELLLKNHAWIDKSEGEPTLLHTGVIYNQKNAVKLLLDHGAFVDAKNNHKMTALHFAAIYGNVEVVKVLIKYHADVNALDDDHYTPLHRASHYGHIQVVSLLIQHQANVNATTTLRKITPLYLAAFQGHKEVIKDLVNHGANVNAADNEGHTPLHVSAQQHCESVVEILLENNADVNAITQKRETPLHLFSYNGEEAAKVLIEYNADVNAMAQNDQTPLHICVKGGHLELAKLLLENKCDADAALNNNKYTALHLSADNDSYEFIKLLLKYNANIHAVAENQSSALHLCAIKGHVHSANILLEHQADVNAMNATGTPLHLSTYQGYTELVRVFLNNNADINAIATKELDTALHIAANRGHEAVVKVLLEHKATVNCKRIDGSTPLHLSAFKGYGGVVRILLEHNADVNAFMNCLSTPLHLSAKNGHTEVVKILLENQANVDVVEADQTTPLHLAVENRHLDIVNILLENHANVNAMRIRETPPPKNELFFLKNDVSYIMKETALTIATEKGYRDIVSILLNHGAISGLEYANP